MSKYDNELDKHNLKFACGNLSTEDVIKAIECGANDWNDGLNEACVSCHTDLEVVKLMIEKGANNFNEALHTTCKWSGNIEIVKLLVSHGANNFTRCFYAAFDNKHYEIMQFLILCGAIYNKAELDKEFITYLASNI
jgi:hypothetical protein